MAEIASVFQTNQIGSEATEGTSTAANRLLGSMSFKSTPVAEVAMYRPDGQKVSTVAAPGREWATHQVTGQPTYTELIYLFSSLLKKVTPSAAGTTGKLWTFNPAYNAADTVASYTLEQGDSNRARKFTGLRIGAATMEFSRQGVTMQGQAISRAMIDNSGAMTSSPTALALIPVLGNQVDFYTASTYAGLAGAARMARGLKLSWAVANRFSPVWPVDSSLSSYAAMVELPVKITGKLTAEADTEGMAVLANLRAGSTLFVRAKATGALIEAGHNYQLQIDTAFKVTGASELKDQDGLVAVEWQLEAVTDATWGAFTEVQVKNTIATL